MAVEADAAQHDKGGLPSRRPLTTERLAADAALPDLRRALPALGKCLTTETESHSAPEHTGLLTSNAGVQLTLHTRTTARPVDPEWETCLLLTP
ncbi:hypothetical protein ACIQUO_29130 [Streptomyces albogriseolus]|uniref:hypothetical protein n=1 Tax=Streptomyces albogriseolus TaxID=1887 RepID=UPI0036BFFD75